MKSWVKFGLVWGVFMFIMLNIVFPLADGSSIALKSFVTLPLWITGGLIFGYVSRKRTQTKQD